MDELLEPVVQVLLHRGRNFQLELYEQEARLCVAAALSFAK